MKKKIVLFTLVSAAILLFAYIYFGSQAKSSEENQWGITVTEELKQSINRSFQGFTTMDKDWIYFSTQNSGSLINDVGAIYKMKPDGTDSTLLVESSGICLSIFKDQLYYIDTSDGSKLVSLSLNNQSKSIVYDGHVLEYVWANDWIYFIEEGDQTYSSKISKMKSDGSAYQVINPKDSINLVLSGDTIYFGTPDDTFSISKLLIDGTDTELILENVGSIPYAVFNNQLLTFSGAINNVVIYDLETLAKRDVYLYNDNYYQSFNFYKDKCYALTPESVLVEIKGKKEKVIFNASGVSRFNIIGDWLFFETRPADAPNTILYHMNLKTGKINVMTPSENQ